MYAQKHSGRATAGRQSSDVLLRALAERHPDLGDHLDGVAELAADVAERLGHRRRGARAAPPRRRAARHRQGRDPRRDHQQARPRSTTTSGRSCAATRSSASASSPPPLRSARAARLVRSSHEAFDGSGYPDGLAGVEIPLGARIIAVCDAFDAMISNRPYSPPKTHRRGARRAPSLRRHPVRPRHRRRLRAGHRRARRSAPSRATPPDRGALRMLAPVSARGTGGGGRRRP